MAVGDHFRLALVGGLNSQEIVQVHHYRQSTANTSADSDVKSLAKAFKEYFIDSSVLLDCQAQAVGYGTIESRSFPLPPTPVVGYDQALVTTGTVEETALPPAVACVIRKRTQYLGRKYRGRTFLAGLGVGAVSGGVVSDATTITNLGTLADTIAAAIVSATAGSPTFVPEICTILRDPDTLVYSYRANDIITAVLDKTLRSQRRREIGRGS